MIIPYVAFTGGVGLELHRTKSSKEHEKRIRRKPHSAYSLHEQFQAGKDVSKTQAIQVSTPKPSQRQRAPHPQLIAPSTSVGLVSPNTEVLQCIGRAPQPGIPQPMPVEAPSSTRHFPVEMSADTEIRRPPPQQTPQNPELPRSLQAGVSHDSRAREDSQRQPIERQSSPTRRNAGEPRITSARHQQSQQSFNGGPIHEKSPLSRLERQISEHKTHQLGKTQSIDRHRPRRDAGDGCQRSQSARPLSEHNSGRQTVGGAMPLVARPMPDLDRNNSTTPKNGCQRRSGGASFASKGSPVPLRVITVTSAARSTTCQEIAGSSTGSSAGSSISLHSSRKNSASPGASPGSAGRVSANATRSSQTPLIRVSTPGGSTGPASTNFPPSSRAREHPLRNAHNSGLQLPSTTATLFGR